MPSDYEEEFDIMSPDEAEKVLSKKPTVEIEDEDAAPKGKVQIEVEDDTPEQDRGRKTSEPPEDVTDDELNSYDEKVQKRIKKFTRGYHDERRAKEAALRERQAAEELARSLLEDNKRLKQQLSAGSQMHIEVTKTAAASELEAAKRLVKEAYESGDAEQIATAQATLAEATWKSKNAETLRPLQFEENDVQFRQAPPKRDEKFEAWRSDNEWFGANRRMTAFALALHEELVQEKGVSPTSDRYYQEIDRTMRKTFPDAFRSREDDDDLSYTSEPASEETPPRRASKPAAVVAPASRSTPPNRVKLTRSQVDIARKLGITPEQYAQQVALLKKD